MDHTLNQTEGEQIRAEELSLRAAIPPAQVPGYRLDRLLGQGAFGQVWVGNNLNTGRTVAIKFYLHRIGVNWSLLTREVKNLVSMSGNRFIVQVLEVGWDSEPPYYVMEYLENGSLDDLIRANTRIPTARAIELFSDIATGLNHSHGKGVLHCDLKPANVLLDPDMQPRLADFGQSRLSNEQTPSLGTLFYMAPEQADLNAIPDVRWDVYALGAILYCMLVGHPPYKTPDTVTTLNTAADLPERLKMYRDTIYKSHFPRQHLRIPGIDRWLIAIIDRCIAKKPEDRFENVQQVLAAMERRRITKMLQPLMLLGIVGPIMLITVMGLFYWRVVDLAESESSRQLKEYVLQSNQYAAKFAARTLESEMSSLFRLIEDEARKDEFESKFLASIDEAGSELLNSLATEKTPPIDAKTLLQQMPLRKQLDGYLQTRLGQVGMQMLSAKRIARFDSLFVTDRFGTQLASAFADEAPVSLIGDNFAYRSYFSGQSQDLDERTPRHNISPTDSSHVSVPFLSKSTNRWKIAVSTPFTIKRPNPGADEATEVEGVMVLTINLGDFELLPEPVHAPGEVDANTEDSQRHYPRFAVLVDGHEGDREGTLLQHPIFGQPGFQSAIRSDAKYQIEDDILKRLKDDKDEGTYEYVDPVSDHEQGAEYGGKWIAAMERVVSSRRMSDSVERKHSTNLWVLVQERAESITAPVKKMGGKLIRVGIVALIALLAVICALWVFVLRVMRLPEGFVAGARSRSSGNTELTGTGNEVIAEVERT